MSFLKPLLSVFFVHYGVVYTNPFQVIGTVIRDSGEIAHILEYEAKVICCSTNGSIRVLNITHNAQNMSVVRATSLCLVYWLTFPFL
jgi:hypothetical protein